MSEGNRGNLLIDYITIISQLEKNIIL